MKAEDFFYWSEIQLALIFFTILCAKMCIFCILYQGESVGFDFSCQHIQFSWFYWWLIVFFFLPGFKFACIFCTSKLKVYEVLNQFGLTVTILAVE